MRFFKKNHGVLVYCLVKRLVALKAWLGVTFSHPEIIFQNSVYKPRPNAYRSCASEQCRLEAPRGWTRLVQSWWHTCIRVTFGHSVSVMVVPATYATHNNLSSLVKQNLRDVFLQRYPTCTVPCARNLYSNSLCRATIVLHMQCPIRNCCFLRNSMLKK